MNAVIIYGTLIPGNDHLTWQIERAPERIARLVEAHRLTAGVVKRIQRGNVNTYYVLVAWMREDED